jgi:hypothetical protein
MNFAQFLELNVSAREVQPDNKLLSTGSILYCKFLSIIT